MAKVESSYAAVTGGVSEQVPQERREGQHTMQVNMVSDPVRGAARRHGSVNIAEVVTDSYDDAKWAQLLGHTANYKTFSCLVRGREYDFVYPTTADTLGLGSAVPFYCIDKTAGTVIPVSWPSGDTMVASLQSGGVSAITNIGVYLFIAGNTITTTYTTTDKWGTSANQSKLAAWVRGGAYNRKYSVTLKLAAGGSLTCSYTTLSAGYPGTLDTSDLLTTDTDYQKKVNDRVNAYNSAVTTWITTSSQDITTQSIASNLMDALVTEGVDPAHINVIEGTVVIDSALYTEITCSDSGDNTLIRGIGNEVTAPELVDVTHYAGKIVKVRPKHTNGDDAFYLQAIAKDGVSTGWTDVYWQEAAGVITAPTSLFVIGTVVDGVMHLAGSPEALDTALGVTSTPKLVASRVGDLITAPLPHFLGTTIDYLGEFQDRLLVGSGSTISMSRSGDYFNWFRASVLTFLDDDPIEEYALGSDGDTIKSSVTFDRNLVLYGKLRQYNLNGRQTMTPTNASIVASSAYEDAIDCAPVPSGNYVFYCNTRDDGAKTSVFQVQFGFVVDSPESYPVSGQLDTFISGTPLELVTVTKPSVVMLRTSTSRNSLYVYTYLDDPEGKREFDAWARWDWSTSVGYQVGMSRHKGDVLVYMLKEGVDHLGSRKIWFAIERFTVSSALSDRPYMDSLRLNSTALSVSPGYINRQSDFLSEVSAAFGNLGNHRFVGTSFASIDAFNTQYGSATSTYVGIYYNAFVTPTNPFVRDRNDKAIINCNLTIARFLVSLRDTGGCTITTMANGATTLATVFNGRITGSPTSAIGTQPIVDTKVTATVGRETRNFSYSIYANKWLPLTITAIEWVGQFFHNARRV